MSEPLRLRRLRGARGDVVAGGGKCNYRATSAVERPTTHAFAVAPPGPARARCVPRVAHSPRRGTRGDESHKRMITAFVLLTVVPGRVGPLAERLLEVPGIGEVYSVAGSYDLVAVVRVRAHDDLADLVTTHVAGLDGIVRTDTLIAFRAFSKRDLGMLWDIGD